LVASPPLTSRIAPYQEDKIFRIFKRYRIRKIRPATKLRSNINDDRLYGLNVNRKAAKNAKIFDPPLRQPLRFYKF